MNTSTVQDYYKKYSFLHVISLLWQRLSTKNRLKKLSLTNKLNDYIAIANSPDLLTLHGKLAAIIEEQLADWPEYDYGEGYFYQSFEQLSISGFRNTEQRYRNMNLEKLVKGKTVLDIGCNAGFLAIRAAAVAKSVTGMDVNPYLIRFGKAVAEHLERSNVSLLAIPFEDFNEDRLFDVVFSFANHSTYDGQTRHTLEAYFDSCRKYLNPEGIFLFESHAPGYEGDKLGHVIELIKERFFIAEQRVLGEGSFLDAGRTFVIAKPLS